VDYSGGFIRSQLKKTGNIEGLSKFDNFEGDAASSYTPVFTPFQSGFPPERNEEEMMDEAGKYF
jgi:hypothetical protein